MSNRTIINLEKGHEDFVLAQGVRGKIVWHGQTYDLAALDLEVAERMARERETRYVNFSDARLAREAEEQARKILPAAPAKGPALPATKEAPAQDAKDDTSAAAAKEQPAAPAGGRQRRSPGKEADAGEATS